MINLISQNKKKRLRIKYYIRLGSIFLNVVTGLMLMSIAFLIPSYITVNEKEKIEYQAFQEIFTEDDYAHQQLMRRIIQETRMQLDLIDSLHDRSFIQNTISTIEQESIDGILVAYMNIDGNRSRVDIRGNAVTRESLLSFINNLEESEYFSRIEAPVSSFLQSTNIPFNITGYHENN